MRIDVGVSVVAIFHLMFILEEGHGLVSVTTGMAFLTFGVQDQVLLLVLIHIMTTIEKTEDGNSDVQIYCPVRKS